MEYYSVEDVERMKENGYDSDAIKRAGFIQEDADNLILFIQEAFHDIKLEDGIGLLEADGLDDYKSPEDLALLRSKDIKENWNEIGPDYINMGWASLAFYDAKGMRFYLPAYMVADIKGQFRFDLDIPLTNICEYRKSQFSLLNKEQRIAVKKYLEYHLTQENIDSIILEIQSEIDGFWSS